MGAKDKDKTNDSQVTFDDLAQQPTPQQLCNLRWIKTPRTYASLGSKFSLLQQDIMLQVSARLQSCINQYYDQMRYKEKTYPKSPFASEEQKNEALHIQIDMSDLVDSHSNYREMFKEYGDGKVPVVEEILSLKVLAKKEKTFDYYPVFDRVSLPRKVWKSADGTEKLVFSGVVELYISHWVADYAFDLSKGYVPHMARVAKTSKRRVTPRVYLWLMENKDKPKKNGKDNPLSVTVDELKDFLGCYDVDPDTHEKVYQYPKYSRFKKDVLDKAKADLVAQAKRNDIDITFDYTEHYPSNKSRGNPDYITFKVFYTPLGRLHKAGKYREGDLFDVKEHVTPVVGGKTDDKIQVAVGTGTDKWKEFIARVMDDNQKSLIARVTFVGMKNKRFCIQCSDDDFGMLKPLGLERLAQEYFGCVGSFAPVFYRG